MSHNQKLHIMPLHHADIDAEPRALSADDFAEGEASVFSPHECVRCRRPVAYMTGMGLCEPCDLKSLEAELRWATKAQPRVIEDYVLG